MTGALKIEKKCIPILMYHSISEQTNRAFKAFTVSPTVFARQMAFLAQNHYTPLTVTQWRNLRMHFSPDLPTRPIVLTFDDGFADFFESAFPILQRYHFPATLYVTTAYMNGTSRWLRRERETNRLMLNYSQLRELQAAGIECGAHSHTHRPLDMLNPMQLELEIWQSKTILERHLERPVFSFAYPYGYFTASVRAFVKQSGFTSACAVRHMLSSFEDDIFSLGRVMVQEQDELAFARLLTWHSLSTVERVQQTYRRMRTPIWQRVRWGVKSLARFSGRDGNPYV